MTNPETPPKSSAGPQLAMIAVLIAATAFAFAFTAGWLSPDRLTPAKIVSSIAPPQGPALGFRRNHAKGICFTGRFDANGNGTSLSTAPQLSAGGYPATGRFNLGVADPKTSDGTARVRGMGLRLQGTGTEGREWRMAMIDAPFFPVATPEAFYELQLASNQKSDPDAMKKFAAIHPEIAAFGAWAGSAPFTASYAEDRFNSINSFVFTDSQAQDRTVRWSLEPVATPIPVSGQELKQRDPDFLSKDIVDRVTRLPQRWTMVVTMAAPGDPTADPSKEWPADRKRFEVGTLVVTRIEPEADGPCRDINFDPTVLPPGIRTSDDPFPAARSAAYSVSFNRRTAEEGDYPRASTGARP